jgi:hypothetical protein
MSTHANVWEAVADVLDAYSPPPKLFLENLPTGKGDLIGEWARMANRPAAFIDADVGGQWERGTGTLYFQHFLPEGAGTKKAWDFADKIGALFNRANVDVAGGGNVLFERAVCEYVGTLNGQVQHNVTIAWRVDAPATNAP